MSTPKLDYLETEEKLKVRIHAHTAYADLKLEDWLLRWLGDCQGQRLLEIGCGDGNFFSTYEKALGPRGEIIGFDINEELLNRANAVSQELDIQTKIFHWDYDHHPFPLSDGRVDILIAPFSAYYTTDVKQWLDESLRVLTQGGRLLLLGPTKDNAKELYQLNEMVTGVRSVQETDETTVKLEREFLPDLEERLGDRVTKRILDRQIIFPSSEELARYYLATWLFEKTRDSLEKPVDYHDAVQASEKTNLRLNKQIICIEATK